MRTLKNLIFPIAILVLFNCKKEPFQPSDHLGEGPRDLHRLVEYERHGSSFSGGYFLFFGSVEGSTHEFTEVKFSWQLPDGTYAIGSLPLEKIRVRLDEKAEVPTIEFYGIAGSDGCEHSKWNSKTQEVLKHNVAHAVVTVRDSDWTPRIQMPLSGN